MGKVLRFAHLELRWETRKEVNLLARSGVHNRVVIGTSLEVSEEPVQELRDE